MKSLAEQSFAELGGYGSVLTRQKRDHVRLDELLRQLEAAGAEHEQEATLLKISRLVFPHAYAEETILWPVIRRVLPDGHELTLRVELEHQEINELATRLEALEHRSPERRQVLDRLMALLRTDVRDEEDLLLPRLQMKLDEPQLRRLGIAWEAVRLTAPTRPHAIVSRRPPGNVVAALPLALLDRCRDMVDAGRLSRSTPFTRPLDALSAALAAASHAVDRLPVFRRGEDRSTHVPLKRRFGWGTVALLAIGTASVGLALASRRDGSSNVA